MVGLYVVHVAAAAFWLGDIAGLVVAFRSAAAARTWSGGWSPGSAWRPWCRSCLVAAGVWMSWIVLPCWGDLVSTGYGLALLMKVALVAIVVLLGVFNNRRLVPAIERRRRGADRRRHLARIVPCRARAVLLAVVAVTAVRVARSPVSSTSASPPAPTLPSTPIEIPLTGGAGTVANTVAPARAGTNEIRLALTDATGEPLDPFETPTVELTEPALELGPLRPLVHPSRRRRVPRHRRGPASPAAGSSRSGSASATSKPRRRRRQCTPIAPVTPHGVWAAQRPGGAATQSITPLDGSTGARDSTARPWPLGRAPEAGGGRLARTRPGEPGRQAGEFSA